MTDTSANSARRYAFNLPWTAVAVGVVFYGVLSGYMAHLASDFDGVIYIFLLGLSAMFAGLGFIMMTRRLVFPRVLELTDEAILLPHGFPRTRFSRIPYAGIIRVSDRGDGINLVTSKENFEITASYLPNIESYHTVRDFICSQALIVIPRQDKREPPSEKTWEDFQFPKPILRWIEPADWPHYRTHLVTTKPLLLRLAKALWFFVRCFCIILVPWLLLQLFQLPTISITGFLWLVIPGALFFTSLHWLNAIYPAYSTEISFRDKGITQFFGKQTWDLNYADFSGWAVVERPFEDRILHILLLQGRSRVFEFALPNTNARDRLMQIFHDKQISQSPDLKPSWESSDS